ncbi:MAG TPA: class I SAM-dependent methyltransferase [Bryobacteraceae bacterium]|nr:class I SAM-dependent methyltransferase [Bryobacteraceae bacterium]
MPENAYHTVPYLTVPRFETHPDRLAAVATMFGMKPAPVRACRVLEIGCGDANNLIPMAYHLPESRFVGIDLADQAIAAARRMIDALGLANIEVIAADLRAIGENFGEFDYVIAHGLYSWVPAEVRDALMAITGARLAPQGVAFISYNANPGRHIRQMLREMMLYHTRHAGDVHERVEQGRWLLEWLGKTRLVRASWRGLLDEEIENLLERREDSLAHDDLGACNDAFYFHEVAEHACTHGMQYLGDASNRQAFDVHGGLSWLGEDAVERAQYLDFMHLRVFGETLLCRAEVPLTRALDVTVFERMSFSCSARLVDGQIEGLNGVRLTAGQANVEPVALALGRNYPMPVPFDELLQHAESRDALRNTLAAMVFTSFAQYHVHDFACHRTVSERPAASHLARYHARESLRVPTVRHGLVELDEPGRQLLLLLDGTRDLDLIAHDLANCPGAPPEEEIRRALPDSLEWMARMGLLEG